MNNQNYAIISGGIVVNIIVWDGMPDWTPPDGSQLVLIGEDQNVAIGDNYSDGVFTATT